MPSRAGYFYLLVCLLLLLIGMNYENNLVHAVAFLMLSLFVLAILHTYSNLSGIEVTALAGHPCFAGEQAEFDVQLAVDGKRVRDNIELRWQGEKTQTVVSVTDTTAPVRLFHPAPSRGRLTPNPLCISTCYPLGLLTSWSWLKLDMNAVVYPSPAQCQVAQVFNAVEGDGRLHSQDSGEDFAGLEQYVPGMPLKHIAWKHYARGKGLHAKSFHQEVDQQCWLTWDALQGLGTENRLSALCYQVLQSEKKGESYGLILPGGRYEPGRGEAHRKRLLTALALYAGGKHGAE